MTIASATIYARRPGWWPSFERGIHDHSGWLRGCRCSICHSALLEDARIRRAVAMVRQGRELRTHVDARRARRHVTQLRAGGWQVRTIARTAGLSERAVWSLLTGPRTRRIELTTGARLLGVG